MPRTTIAGDLPAPMLARLQPEMPRGPGWSYEPKWDGFRAIVAAGGGGVRLHSRDGRPLGRYFPEVIASLEPVAGTDLVADGEIVRIDGGAMEFDQLQLRLHPADSRVRKLAAELPASLVVFDLLRLDGGDLLDLPLEERRGGLEQVARIAGWARAPDTLDAVPPAPVVLVAPWTEDPERAGGWFDDEDGLGLDGILAKRTDQAYRPGERGWVKVKHRRTLDVVVGGYRLSKGGDGVGALLLGLYDANETLHYVGHTSSFKAAERREMLAILAELEGGASFEAGRAPGGPSRWSRGREPEWVALEPVLVCEVEIDRMQYGRFRHAATFIRWRPDRRPPSCTFAQVGADPPPWAGDPMGSAGPLTP